MFRIRRIYDTSNPINRRAVEQVQAILRKQFPLIHSDDIRKLPDQLKNPLKYSFRSVIFVAENNQAKVRGFALLLYAPDLDFCYLDYLSAASHLTGRGIGGAIYERVREEASALKAKGLFFECLPDDPALCRDPAVLRENSSRLRFYERYGARPIVGTLYETPLKKGGDNPPYLVLDTLGKEPAFRPNEMRLIIEAILKRKYHDVCDRNYVAMVCASVKDSPIRLRPFKHTPPRRSEEVRAAIPKDKLIGLVFNNQHAIHHVKERGYVETPVRVETILAALEKTGFFSIMQARHFADHHISAVHDKRFFEYLHRVCMSVPDGESIYPYVFPIRNNARPPRELPMRAGYYCIDTFTPLNKNAYLAARNAVNCALTAARYILDGAYLAYALVRPPGHHAEKNVFGGFCYFNSTAIAANYLANHGKVAILDIDYHHGNGQQDIFYNRSDVLTVSIHGHPRFAYPFFSGFNEECGTGKGRGFNLNFPLPETTTTDRYMETLKKALHKIESFEPSFLVVALGIDTARGDPTGTWPLSAADFQKMGALIGNLPFSTVFVQEGGYKTRSIGANIRSFFAGVWKGSFE